MTRRVYAPVMAWRVSAVAVTQAEAALILGCSVPKVRSLIEAGVLADGDRYAHPALDRNQVESLAAQMWKVPRPEDLRRLRKERHVEQSHARRSPAIDEA